jgi:hypothetical protein
VSALADSGAPGAPAAFAVLPGPAAFRGVAGLAVLAKLAGLATCPGLATRPGRPAPGRPARSRPSRSRAGWSRSPVPELAAAAAASATTALATSSGCGRDTSLARIAASTVIFIVGIVASRLSLARTGCQPAPGPACPETSLPGDQPARDQPAPGPACPGTSPARPESGRRPGRAARHGTAARPLRMTTGIRWIAACPQERTPGQACPEGRRLWR